MELSLHILSWGPFPPGHTAQQSTKSTRGNSQTFSHTHIHTPANTCTYINVKTPTQNKYKSHAEQTSSNCVLLGLNESWEDIWSCWTNTMTALPQQSRDNTWICHSDFNDDETDKYCLLWAMIQRLFHILDSVFIAAAFTQSWWDSFFNLHAGVYRPAMSCWGWEKRIKTTGWWTTMTGNKHKRPRLPQTAAGSQKTHP